MNKKFLSIAVFGLALAVVFAFSAFNSAQAQRYWGGYPPVGVDRDLGAFNKWDANQFGDDQAYSSAVHGTDRDAGVGTYFFVPETYGLSGDYWYYSHF